MGEAWSPLFQQVNASMLSSTASNQKLSVWGGGGGAAYFSSKSFSWNGLPVTAVPSSPETAAFSRLLLSPPPPRPPRLRPLLCRSK